MKAPHEQEWSVRQTAYGPVVESGSDEAVCLVYLPAAEKGETYASARKRCDTRAVLISAAPDMAQALLNHGAFGGESNADWHTHSCWVTKTKDTVCLGACELDRAALRKAGVIS